MPEMQKSLKLVHFLKISTFTVIMRVLNGMHKPIHKDSRWLEYVPIEIQANRMFKKIITYILQVHTFIYEFLIYHLFYNEKVGVSTYNSF